MSAAAEILETLQTLGVTVTLIPPDRLRLEPASCIPPELVLRVREAKREILEALARPTVQPAECKHCDGTGKCSYACCTLRRTEKAVPCLMCHPRERQVWLAGSRPEGCWHCSGGGKCKCVSCLPSGVCGVCNGSGKAGLQ